MFVRENMMIKKEALWWIFKER